jgi:hypothetical protein
LRDQKKTNGLTHMATYLDAAQIILKEAGRSMSQEEITKLAIERNLIIPGGPTPDKSMGSLIYVDIKKHGERSRFILVGKNQFALNDPKNIDPLLPKNTEIVQQKPRQRSQTGLSYRQAAQIVLSENGHPMNATEIAQIAIEKGLITPLGKTPHATMNAQIYTEMLEHGEKSIFIKVSRGIFFLRNNSSGIEAVSDSALSNVKYQTQQYRQILLTNNQLSSDINSHLQVLQKEIDTIRLFLLGRLENHPTDEKLCDWVLFCYTAEMYLEGRDLFPLINQDSVQSWYFEKTKKLARLCSLKVTNHA